MKKGFTLIELLVTVGLFTIIITIAVGGFTDAIRTQRQVSSLIAAQSNVSLALEQMARQIRTGYLFCTIPGAAGVGNGPSVFGPRPNGADGDCQCVLSSSIPDPLAPGGSWTCAALDFYDAEGNEIIYELSPDGELMEGVNSSSSLQSITGDTVSVKYLNFEVFGQTEGDSWPPRVTISIGIAPSSTDPAVANDVINLQTTVSARSIDCVPFSSVAQC
jgi:prepilin-type N-terminal cleavage/methylation domain-containing protein